MTAPRDLREWMRRVEAIGQLERITEPVSRNEALSLAGQGRTKVRRSRYDAVAARWASLGFRGTPPALWSLED